MTSTTSASEVTFRAAAADDIPRMAEMIAAAELPPIFIEEFLDGFIAAEREGELLACGGVEIYGGCVSFAASSSTPARAVSASAASSQSA